MRNIGLTYRWPNRSEQERFEAFVSKMDVEECWPWKGYLDKKGYGRFDGRLAHRVSFRIYKDYITAGMTTFFLGIRKIIYTMP